MRIYISVDMEGVAGVVNVDQCRRWVGFDHEHVLIEQTYVLEGELVDPDGVCTPGNYVWRPAGSRHSAHTPKGGLMLSMFQAPNKFFERDGAVNDMLGRDWNEHWGTARNLHERD